MSYGAVIFNNNQEVLIDDQNPVYVSKASGTLDAWASGGVKNAEGMYEYDMMNFYKSTDVASSPSDGLNPNFRVFPDETLNGDGTSTTRPADYDIEQNNSFLFFKIPVGFRAKFGIELGKGFEMRGIISDVPNQEFHVVSVRSGESPPSGYGMAIYNALGQCMWDDRSIVGYIAAGKGSLPKNITLNHQTGALWVSCPINFHRFYTPNSYNGSTSELCEYSFYRPNDSQIIYSSYFCTRVGNAAGNSNPAPAQSPVLVGKF